MTRGAAARALRLYVNIDHVATIREARKTDEPDPVAAAALCEDAGANGITVHLREDRRHIQDHDVERLAERIRTVLNLELATSDDVLALARRIRPFQATIVPERREEITTEGGLELLRPSSRLRRTIDALADAGSRVSLFINPEIWLHDYPPDIQARYGPASDKAITQRKILSALVFPPGIR